MRLCFISGNFPIIYRIEKEKWPAVLGYVLLILGLTTAIVVTCETFYKTENSEINLEALLKKTPDKIVNQMTNPLPALFYPDGQEDADADADQERFRVTRKLASDTLLMTAPVAKLPMKVVGLLCDKGNHAGMAIIEASGRQQSYLSDSAINDIYPIIKIFPDRIIINENGFYAALILES